MEQTKRLRCSAEFRQEAVQRIKAGFSRYFSVAVGQRNKWPLTGRRMSRVL
jgi:hypothetical protein